MILKNTFWSISGWNEIMSDICSRKKKGWKMDTWNTKGQSIAAWCLWRSIILSVFEYIWEVPEQTAFKKRWLLLLFHIICLIVLSSSAGHDRPRRSTKAGKTVTHVPYECSSWNSSLSQKSVPQFPVTAFTQSLFKMAFMG